MESEGQIYILGKGPPLPPVARSSSRSPACRHAGVAAKPRAAAGRSDPRWPARWIASGDVRRPGAAGQRQRLEARA